MMVDVFKTGRFDDVEMIVDGGYLDHQELGGQPLRGPSGFKSVVPAARSGFDSLDVIVEAPDRERRPGRRQTSLEGSQEVWRESGA
jgi:hypothetical protein